MLTSAIRKQLLIGYKKITRKDIDLMSLEENNKSSLLRYTYRLMKAFSSSRYYLKEDINNFFLNANLLKNFGKRVSYSFKYNVSNLELTTVYEDYKNYLEIKTFEPNYINMHFKNIDFKSNFLENIVLEDIVDNKIEELISNKISQKNMIYKREYIFTNLIKNLKSSVSFSILVKDDFSGLTYLISTSNKEGLFSDKDLRYLYNHMFPKISNMNKYKILYSNTNVNILELFDKVMFNLISKNID